MRNNDVETSRAVSLLCGVLDRRDRSISVQVGYYTLILVVHYSKAALKHVYVHRRFWPLVQATGSLEVLWIISRRLENAYEAVPNGF